MPNGVSGPRAQRTVNLNTSDTINTMDHDRLEADLKGSAAVRLLRADSAPMVVSALYRLFKRKQQLSVAYDEALEILDGHLGVLNEPEPVYRLASNEYLKQWADDQHRWITTRASFHSG